LTTWAIWLRLTAAFGSGGWQFPQLELPWVMPLKLTLIFVGGLLVTPGRGEAAVFAARPVFGAPATAGGLAGCGLAPVLARTGRVLPATLPSRPSGPEALPCGAICGPAAAVLTLTEFVSASGGVGVLVDQAIKDGFSVDPFGVEGGSGDTARVAFVVGRRCAMPW
jgi:hypothetical protein